VDLDPDNLVKPMRRPLKAQVALGRKIYITINADAAKHFSELKTKHPDRWVDLTLGELFHLIEAGTGDPLQAMQNAFAERPSHADAKLRIRIGARNRKT